MRAGSCARPGAREATLNPVSADSSGQGRAVSFVDLSVDSLLSQPYVVVYGSTSVAVAPDSARVFVANGHSHSVSVVDASTQLVVDEIAVGRRPWGITISPDGRWVYTANGISNDVSVIDAFSLRVVATIPAGDGPWGVAIMRGDP